MEYVTVEELMGLVGGMAAPDRAASAVGAANALIATWAPGDPEATEPTATQHQAGLELALTFYRRQSAAGGYLDQGDLIAQLPPDVSRGVRELLDADATEWGIA